MSLQLKLDQSVGVVTLDRPAKLNALDIAAFRQIEQVIDRANSDRNIRALVFAAAPGKAFSAGADIGDLAGIPAAEAHLRASFRREVLQKLVEVDVPTIAAIDGFAMGGGVELALACTFRLATSRATFSMPEIRLGLLPGAGATQRLPRLIGMSGALDLMLTARPVEADEALRIGLIDRIVADATGAALEMAAQWQPFSRDAVRGIMVASRASELPIREGLVREGEELALLSASPDGIEGVAAFLEKRPAVFNQT